MYAAVCMPHLNTLTQRTFAFAIATFRLCRPLMRTAEARVPVGQLVRSSASVAANYRSSCRAKSKRDFIAKLGTVIEESDESLFWLEYLVATTLLTGPQVKKLQSESNELVAVFTASQKTARANYIHEKNRRHALRRKRTADQQP
jgi:four helix bundle protein